MSQEIVVVAIAEARPGEERTVESAIRSCVPLSRAEVGCLAYAAHVDRDVAGRFVFLERWKSREALAAHEKEPHFQTMAKAFEGRLTKPLQILVLDELT